MMMNLKRERSPMNSPGDDRQESVRERSDRERSRRGDRPSRFGPLSSNTNMGGRKGQTSNRIFVSNVAYEFQWQDLKDLFRDEVGTVSYVELFTDEQGKPRGSGIIEFEAADSVQKAVDKMHRYELKGRKLVVKEDFNVLRDKCGRPLKGGGGGDGLMGSGGGREMISLPSRLRDEPRPNWDLNTSPLPPSLSGLGQVGGGGGEAIQWGNTYGLSPKFLEDLWINGPLVSRVFVANLDYKVDRKKLKEVFKMAGRVISAELNTDRDGKSRGFGVIQYEHPVEAVQAISMFNNHSLYERKMTVRMDRQENKQDGPIKLPDGLQSIGMGLGTNGVPLLDVSRNLPSLSQVPSNPTSTVPASTVDLSANLTAAALSNTLNTSSLAGLGHSGSLQVGLGGLGNGLLGSALSNAGGLSGLGAGSFSGSALGGGSLASLGAANTYSGGYGGGLTSSFTAGRDFEAFSAALKGAAYRGEPTQREFQRHQPPPMARGAGGMRGTGTAGGPPPLAGSNGTQGSDTVIVKNLPSTMTWQMLRDKFRDLGEIKYAEMRGKDVGLIRFTKERDAERAVYIMDRKRIDNAIIEVALFN